eukprot:s3116_g12.t1
MASVALGGTDLRFVWQAWPAFYGGSAGTLGSAWSPVTPRRFAWQARHLATSTFVLYGKRGHAWVRLVACDAAAFCVAGATLSDIDLRSVWQAWDLEARTFVLCGKRGLPLWWVCWHAWVRLVACDAVAFCLAGVALGGTDLRFAWQAQHLETRTFISGLTY